MGWFIIDWWLCSVSCFEIQSTRFMPCSKFLTTITNLLASLRWQLIRLLWLTQNHVWTSPHYLTIECIITLFDDHFVSCLTFDFTLTIIQCQMCLSETSGLWLWLICLTNDSEQSGVLRHRHSKGISTRHGNVYLTAIIIVKKTTLGTFTTDWCRMRSSHSQWERFFMCQESQSKFLPSN